MKRTATLPLLALAALLVGACGGDVETDDSADMDMDMGSETPMQGATAGDRAVLITSPMEGEVVEGPEVTVTLEARGFQVVQAGDSTANSGHHHIFLDRDVSVMGVPIPAEEGFIVHMGDGSESYTFQNVAPGSHRLIAVVGDAYHIPVPGLVDTLTFTVE